MCAREAVHKRDLVQQQERGLPVVLQVRVRAPAPTVCRTNLPFSDPQAAAPNNGAPPQPRFLVHTQVIEQGTDFLQQASSTNASGQAKHRTTAPWQAACVQVRAMRSFASASTPIDVPQFGIVWQKFLSTSSKPPHWKPGSIPRQSRAHTQARRPTSQAQANIRRRSELRTLSTLRPSECFARVASLSRPLLLPRIGRHRHTHCKASRARHGEDSALL